MTMVDYYDWQNAFTIRVGNSVATCSSTFQDYYRLANDISNKLFECSKCETKSHLRDLANLEDYRRTSASRISNYVYKMSRNLLSHDKITIKFDILNLVLSSLIAMQKLKDS